MGSYIQSNLLNEETVAHEGELHWAVYLRPAIVTAILLLITANSPELLPLAIVISALFFVFAFLQHHTTELAITNKRVLAKFGIIRRNTIELRLDQIEGATLKQGIFGRLLGYASIVVRGTGGGAAPVPFIAMPEEFRRKLNEQMETVRSR